MEIISGSSRLETELRLGLPGGSCEVERNEKKRGFSCFTDDNVGGGEVNSKKNQVVVGWPPVRAYRQKSMMKMYVKVSMDGAPFLRKIDLCMHKGYSHLALALEQLFGCVGIGNALKDAEDYEYVAIYEDKDDDWMMLGDVPWEMFAETCKRLRIMRKSDAKGSIGLHAEDLLKGLITKDE